MSVVAIALGTAATVASCVLLLSPWELMQKVKSDKSTGDLSIFPYVSLMCNGCVWFMFGIAIQDVVVSVVNAFGCSIAGYYTHIFWSNMDTSKKPSARTLLFVSIGAVAMLLLGSILAPPDLREGVLGTVGTLFCVIAFASPLATVKLVITSRNSSSLPLPLCLMNFVVGVSWTLYGLVIQRWPIIVPNLVGVTLGIIQLSLYFIYREDETMASSKPVGV